MGAHIKLQFIKLHTWTTARMFEVYHTAGPRLTYPLTAINGEPIRLRRNGWEQAGLGHGRFGTGSFGWGQGGLTGGGFGFGRFGLGECGYYNEPVEWISPKPFPDGLHTFGVSLVGSNGSYSPEMLERRVLIVSRPEAPRALMFKQMNEGIAIVECVPAQEW